MYLETPIVPYRSAEIVRSETLAISSDIFAYCLLIVLTLQSRTKPDPEPISIGGETIVKSELKLRPPSVTTIELTSLLATVIFAFNPVPDPPNNGISKNCPFVNPDPATAIIIDSTN